MITYFSVDRKILNATLWLGGGVSSILENIGAETVVYGLLVDSDNNEDTGKYRRRFSKRITMEFRTRKLEYPIRRILFHLPSTLE